MSKSKVTVTRSNVADIKIRISMSGSKVKVTISNFVARTGFFKWGTRQIIRVKVNYQGKVVKFTSRFIIGSSNTAWLSLRALCTHSWAQADITGWVVDCPTSIWSSETSILTTGKLSNGPTEKDRIILGRYTEIYRLISQAEWWIVQPLYDSVLCLYWWQESSATVLRKKGKYTWEIS